VRVARQVMSTAIPTATACATGIGEIVVFAMLAMS
jgi:hypothetical protein